MKQIIYHPEPLKVLAFLLDENDSQVLRWERLAGVTVRQLSTSSPTAPHFQPNIGP